MIINHIASGSTGNAIVVNDGCSKLMFDAGLSFRKLSQEVRFSDMEGIFITHEHWDHAKAVPKLSHRGYPVYCSKGTALAIGEKEGTTIFFNTLTHGQQVNVGSWIVLPFNVKHDAEEPMGFLFQSRETEEKGVYIADSAYIEFSFKGVQYWLIEANYSEELLEESNDEQWLKDRIRRSHFSFDDLIKFFDTSDLSQAKEIHLIHLSDRNSNEQEFKSKLVRRYGVPVFSISDNEKFKKTA